MVALGFAVIGFAFLHGKAEPRALFDGFEQRGIHLRFFARGDKQKAGAHGDELYRF